MLIDHSLAGHILHMDRSYRVAGRDTGGRLWARPCSRGGVIEDERLVELHLDAPPVRRLLAAQLRR